MIKQINTNNELMINEVCHADFPDPLDFGDIQLRIFNFESYHHGSLELNTARNCAVMHSGFLSCSNLLLYDPYIALFSESIDRYNSLRELPTDYRTFDDDKFSTTEIIFKTL